MTGTKGRFYYSRELYCTFLRQFSKSPIFTRQKIEYALRGIYKSDASRALAYVAIMEHRRKVEQDLRKLEKNINVRIVSFAENEQQPRNEEEYTSSSEDDCCNKKRRKGEKVVLESNLINNINNDLTRLKDSLAQLEKNLGLTDEKRSMNLSIPPCPEGIPISHLQQKKLSSVMLIDLTQDGNTEQDVKPIVHCSNCTIREQTSSVSKEIPVITL